MRPFAVGDLELLIRHHGDTAVMALMKGGVQSPAQAQAELEGYLATWRDHGYGMWALYNNDDDAFIGEAGVNRGVQSPQDRLLEVVGADVEPEHEPQGMVAELSEVNLRCR